MLMWRDLIGPILPFREMFFTLTFQTDNMVSVQSADGTRRDVTCWTALALLKGFFSLVGSEKNMILNTLMLSPFKSHWGTCMF